MRGMIVLVLLVASLPMSAAVLEQEADIQGDYVKVLISPKDGAPVEEFTLLSTGHDLAGVNGLVQEGFGVGQFYVPNRRLNQRLEILESNSERPVLQYSYDCDGPNIAGLHVTRTMEPLPNEASLRVHWKVEHKGTEEQWVAPWVRNEAAPGGTVDANDIVNVATLSGIENVKASGYRVASRNWIAATDPQAQETLYGVFDADKTHSFLALKNAEEKECGFQTAFVPVLLKPGDVWETTYRVNAVRGLSHVDFASDELAAQVDYAPGELVLLVVFTKAIPPVTIQASVLASNDQVWHLDKKRFEGKPGTVVRCTYNWAAPADGAYDFLAQLTTESDGKPYALGKDTASPHGGIDTQFVAGKPKTVSFEPWTNAPLALQRGARTLERQLAVPGDTAIWFESSLNKVFREDVPKHAGEYQPKARIGLAKNERESFQLVIRPPEGQNISKLNVKVQDLVNSKAGSRIPASNVSVYRVGYCPVRVPSHFEGPTGDYPDPLPAFQSFTATGGACSPVWFTISAPADLPAGTYTGMLELTSPDLEPVELWIEATVYDFTLPTTPALKTDFRFWPEEALQWCKAFGFKGSQEDVNAAYLDNAFDHRVTLRELTQLPAESADYQASLAAYEPKLDDLLKRGVSTISVPATLLDVPEQLMMAADFVAKHDLKGKAFSQMADNPLKPAWPRVLERMQQWIDAFAAAPESRIPVMTTALGLQPFLHEGTDIWCVHTPIFDTANNRAILERIQGGKEIWWYVNYSPPRPYANFFTDFAAIEHRILFWQTWTLGIRGMYYWGINITEEGQNPWQGQLDVTPANGDGFLVYPSAKGPVNSIRWEVIRDGIDDYDYLVLLKQGIDKLREKGGNQALLDKAAKAFNIGQLVPDLVTFPRDPKILEAKREEIARVIEQLQAGQ